MSCLSDAQARRTGEFTPSGHTTSDQPRRLTVRAGPTRGLAPVVIRQVSSRPLSLSAPTLRRVTRPLKRKGFSLKTPAIFCILALSLTACATTSEPAVRTVEIKVPVRTPCTLTPPVEPEWADTDEALRDAPDHVARVRALVIGRLQRIAHDQELHAYATACAQ